MVTSGHIQKSDEINELIGQLRRMVTFRVDSIEIMIGWLNPRGSIPLQRAYY